MTTPSFLNNKTILVTGGTGSFGSAFVRFLLDFPKVKKVIVFSRDELKQSELARELRDRRLRFFLGDVRDGERLERAFHGVDIVVHAAALKQVPTLEYNPFEAVKTNILGSQNVINAAIDAGVEKALLISTDKAVEPINLYGSTKQVAEKLFVAGNFYAAGLTKCATVRYGNVIGSRGSLIELLQRKRDAKEFELTDPAMTRFWLSLEESFSLVLKALSHMVGGEIFVPSEIRSSTVTSVFEALRPEAKLRVTGIRPGEKLHETLLTAEEADRSVQLDSLTVILPANRTAMNPGRFRVYETRGKKLPASFSMRSNKHDRTLSAAELKSLVSKGAPTSKT